MAKVSFTNLKLKVDTSTKTVEIGNNKIKVLQYLPVEDKYDLVMITLQKAYEEGIYNPIKLEKYFHLYLVYMYSNINFTDKQKEDENKLYNILESNGIINSIIDAIPEEEFNKIFNYLSQIMTDRFESKKYIGSVISNFITDLPNQMQTVQQMVNDFDPNQYQAVLDFAKAANGGRDIK